jgi:DNA (cytosine-5)-methyltransferase 1
MLCKTDSKKGTTKKAMVWTVLSLFSGMAGTDVGFSEEVIVPRASVPVQWTSRPADTHGFVHLKRLPFETVFQNDILKDAKTIAELNGWAHNYVLRDIWELLAENYPLPAADVVTGGFPCQDFSHAGKRRGFDSERGNLYKAFVEVVRRVSPKVFVAENVEGLLTIPGAIETIVSDFAALGYDVKYTLIKCEDYGIPQTRHRVIIMGVRKDLGLIWDLVLDNAGRRVPLQPYFEHLQEPEDSPDPAQQRYSKAAKLEKGQGQKAVDLDQPGPTMRAEHHGNIEFRRHGEHERRLTVREAALIQTFPPACRLTAGLTAYKPIGNAVPPLLGYLVGRLVRKLLTQHANLLTTAQVGVQATE